MAVHKATLAKIVNGIVEYVYPKTTSDIVIYEDTVTVYDKLNDLNDSISSNVTAIANLKTSVSEINTNIDNISENVDINTTDITALKASVNTNIKDIATNLSSITTLQSDLSTAQDKIDYLDENKTDKDYTAEVLYYFNRQSSDYINSGSTNQIHGECNIIKAYDKIIMIDTGGYNRSDDIEAYLTEIGVTKVDYLIISHWHMDHCSNFTDGLMNYIDWSDCICYFPVDVPSWMLDYSSATSYKSKAVAYAEANCKEIIYPEEYDELVLNDYFKITFFNCGTSYLDEIKALQDDIEEFAGHLSSSYSSQYYMNDSSMVCLVKHLGVKVFYSGDVMKAAQQRIYKAGFANDVDLYKMHHHAINTQRYNQQVSNYLYCNMLNPTNVVVQNSAPTFYLNVNLDIDFFQLSNIYQPIDNYIIYSSKQNNLQHVTEDKQVHVTTNPDYQELIIFVDWSKTLGIDEDGSYWNPFSRPNAAVRWAQDKLDSGRLGNMPIALVIMPGDSFDGASDLINMYSLDPPYRMYVRSYDYYKDSSQFSISNGVMDDSTKELCNKYIFRGLVYSKSDMRIYGIHFAHNNTTFASAIASWMQSNTTVCTMYGVDAAHAKLSIGACMLDLDEVIVDDLTSKPTYAVMFNLNGSSEFNIYDSYISNVAFVATFTNDNAIAKITNIQCNKVTKLLNNNTSKYNEGILQIGKWLLNLELSNGDFTHSTDTQAICFDVNIKTVCNADATFSYNDETLTAYDIIKRIQYPIQYKDMSNPLILGNILLNGSRSRTFEFQCGSTSDPRWYDPYGGRYELYQCGGYILNGGIDIMDLVSISEDYYDLDNIKFPGCWTVVGTAVFKKFSNIPDTNLNGKLICDWFGSSAASSGATFRQTYMDRQGRKFERIYDANMGYWSKWITITGNMYTDYEDEETEATTTSNEETTE